MSFRSLLLVLIAFAAGWGSARYFSPAAQAPVSQAETIAQPPAGMTGEGAASPRPLQVAATVPQPQQAVQTQAQAQAHGTPTIPSGPNRVVDPNQNEARGDPSRKEFEEHLLDQIRDRFPEARMIVRKANPDGTYVSKENLDDGGTVARSFNSQGQLVGEDWKQAGGEDIIRSYYDGGGVKGFSIKYAGGGDTNVTFTQSGLFKARSDDYADGTHVYTNYDDQGQVYERWQKGKDGKSVRIQ